MFPGCASVFNQCRAEVTRHVARRVGPCMRSPRGCRSPRGPRTCGGLGCDICGDRDGWVVDRGALCNRDCTTPAQHKSRIFCLMSGQCLHDPSASWQLTTACLGVMVITLRAACVAVVLYAFSRNHRCPFTTVRGNSACRRARDCRRCTPRPRPKSRKDDITNRPCPPLGSVSASPLLPGLPRRPKVAKRLEKAP